jgi:hypothetical protein
MIKNLLLVCIRLLQCDSNNVNPYHPIPITHLTSEFGDRHACCSPLKSEDKKRCSYLRKGEVLR